MYNSIIISFHTYSYNVKNDPRKSTRPVLSKFNQKFPETRELFHTQTSSIANYSFREKNRRGVQLSNLPCPSSREYLASLSCQVIQIIQIGSCNAYTFLHIYRVQKGEALFA